MNDHVTFSVFEFFKRFPDAEAARLYIEEKRWHGKPVCPHCGCDYTQVACTRKDRKGNVAKGYYQCEKCRKVYTVRTGTVMERSRIPLNKWLFAFYYVLTARHGVSSYQLSKHIDVHQESAWFLLQRIREACKVKANQELLEGIIEVDEAYIGGKEMNKHEKKKLKKGRGTIGKTAVIGLRARRSGKTYAFVVPNTNRSTVHKLLCRWVKKGSTILTDEASVYDGLDDFQREVVNHGRKEFARGDVTTNRIESVWACAKRSILGTWHFVSPKHLQRYIDEVCFRLGDGNVEQHLTDRMDCMLEDALTTPHMSYEDMKGTENPLMA